MFLFQEILVLILSLKMQHINRGIRGFIYHFFAATILFMIILLLKIEMDEVSLKVVLFNTPLSNQGVFCFVFSYSPEPKNKFLSIIKSCWNSLTHMIAYYICCNNLNKNSGNVFCINNYNYANCCIIADVTNDCTNDFVFVS